MTQKTATLNTLKKIKAFAIGLVGSGILSMGSTYFSEQSTYRVPRLLLPIYEIFGNVGLAIGMLILGAALIFYAFWIFTNHEGRKSIFVAYVIVCILTFYGIIYVSSKKPIPNEVKNSLVQNEIEEKAKIQNAKRPKLNNEFSNAYLDKLELSLSKFQQAQNENSKALFDEAQKEYITVVSRDTNKAFHEIVATKEYGDFMMYNAKILSMIQEVRTDFANR